MNKKIFFVLLIISIVIIFMQGCETEHIQTVPSVLADEVDDIPSSSYYVNGDKNKKYILIGPDKMTIELKMVLGLIVVIAPEQSGEGQELFIKKIYKALPKRYIMAQLVPVKWTEDQKRLWPIEKTKTSQQQSVPV